MAAKMGVLIVEDHLEDAELMVRHLRKEGFAIDWQRVETESDYLEALEAEPDLILADWSLPQFGGQRALQLMEERGLDIPFIIVSATIGEEPAVTAMRAGAADYVLKDRMARLGPAVRRARDQRKLRKKRRQAETKLKESEELYRQLFEAESDAIFLFEQETGRILEANQAAVELYGYNRRELLSKTDTDLSAEPEETPMMRTSHQAAGSLINIPLRYHRKSDGMVFPVEITGRFFNRKGRTVCIAAVRDVTERKKAEEELRREKDFAENLIKTAQAIVLLLDPQGRIVQTNPYLEKLSGYSSEELIGRDWFKTFLPDEDRPEIRELFSKAIGGSHTRGNVNPIVAKDGSKRQIEWHDRTLLDEQGEIIGLLAIGQDVTERLLAEEARNHALIETNGLLKATRAIHEQEDFAQAARAIFNVCGKLIGAPAGYVALLNEAAEENELLFLEAGGLPCSVNPGLPMPIRGMRADAYRLGKAVYENDFAHSPHMAFMPEGHVLLENVLFAPIKLDGEAVGLIGLANKSGGFTERDARLAEGFGEIASLALSRFKAREALIKSEEQYRMLADNASDVIWTQDLKTGKFTYVSPSVQALRGYSPEEALALPLDKTLTPDSFKKTMTAYYEAMDRERDGLSPAGATILMELEEIHKDGSIVPTESRIRFLRDDQGKPVGLLGISRDNTERKRAEAALRDSEARFATVFRSSPIAISITRLADAQYFDVNDAFLKMNQYSREELIGHTAFELNLWADREDRTQIAKVLREQGRVNNLEVRFRRKSGELGHALSSAELIELNGEQYMLSLLNDITERKQAEAELREREERHRSVLENSSDAIFLSIPDGRILTANPAACRMFGYAEEEFRSSGRDIFIDPTDPKLVDALQERSEQGSYHGELTFKRRNGETFRGEVVSTIFPGPDGQLRSTVVVRDITERKRAEEELRRSEAALKKAQEVANVGSWAWHVQSNRVEWSDQMYRIFGLDKETFTGDLADVIARAIHPDDRAAVEQSNLKVIREKTPTPMEYRVIWPDGTVRTVRAEAGEIVLNGAGRVIILSGIAQDITERKLAESIMRARLEIIEYAATHSLEEILEKTLDEVCPLVNSPIGFFHFVEPDQKTLSLQAWSTKTLEEFCRAEGHGMHYGLEQAGVWTDCVHQRRPVIHNDYKSLPHRKGLPNGHADITRELVVPILREDRIAAILGVGNKPTNYTDQDVETVTFLADVAWEIKTRKQAEEAVKRSEEWFASIFRTNPASIAISRLEDMRYIDVNDTFEVLSGFSREEAVGRTGLELNLWVDPGERDRYLAKLRDQGAVYDFEFQLKHKSGRILSVLLAGETTELANEQYVIQLAQDITERKQAEEERKKLQAQLLQSQKMESVGRLAGGVAHDFNNMLQIILGHCEIALEETTEDNPLREDLREIQLSAYRSAELTRQLLAFARKQTVAPKVLDLNDTIEGMLKMLRRLIGEDIDLLWKPGQGLWQVKLDPSQIDQVLANLMVNARDAIAGNGKVTIETENVHLDDSYTASHLDFTPGPYVILSVSDDGSGMSREIIDNIFEPFFTTKKAGEGTGLGLATVYGIVKQNEGFINVYSEPGKGTTFKIYLPRFESEVAEVAIELSAKTPLGRGETVLLVEDETAVLTMGEKMLTRLGYSVLTADAPEEALRLIEKYQGEIRLLITDVVMPQMDGRELSERLSAVQPDLKCLFMSGYTANAIAHRGVLDEGVVFVQKPFSLQDLAAKVREALDR